MMTQRAPELPAELPAELPYIPVHVVYAHILPHLGIDTRRSFGIFGRLPRGAVHVMLEDLLRRRQTSTTHSAGASLAWSKVRIPGAGKALVYRSHGSVRALDLVQYRPPRGRVPRITVLWEDA